MSTTINQYLLYGIRFEYDDFNARLKAVHGDNGDAVMILLVHDLCWSFLDRMRLGVKNNAIPKPMSRTGHHTEINVQMDTCRRPRLSRSNRRPRPIRQAGKKKPWRMQVIVRKRKGVCHKGGHRRFLSFTRDAIGPSTVFGRIANFSYNVQGALVLFRKVRP